MATPRFDLTEAQWKLLERSTDGAGMGPGCAWSSCCAPCWRTLRKSTGASSSSTPPSSAPAAPPRGLAKRGSAEPPDHAFGRSRGGFSTKLHLLTDGRGRPMARTVTGGQAGELPQVPLLLDAVRV